MKESARLLFLLAFVVACAPHEKHLEFEKGRTNFGPNKQDVVIPKLSGSMPHLVWAETIPGAYFDRWLENLTELGDQAQDPQTQALANRLFSQIQSVKYQKPIPYGQTAYPQMIIQQAKESTLARIDDGLKIVNSNLNQLHQFLNQLPPAVSDLELQNPDPLELQEIGSRAQQIISTFSNQTQTMDLYPVVKEALRNQLAAQTLRLQNITGTAVPRIQQANQFSDVIKLVQDVLSAEKVQLDSATSTKLIEAAKIGQMIDSTADAQGAFSLVIEIWKQLEESQRIKIIQPLSATLFKFLDGKSEDQLNCLQDVNCRQFLSQLEKGLFILPAIEKFGVDKIRQSVNDQGRAYALIVIRSNLQKLLNQLPQYISTTLDNEFGKQTAIVQNIRDHFDEEIQKRVQTLVQARWPSTGGKLAPMKAYSLKISMDQTDLHAQASAAELTAADVAADLGVSASRLANSNFSTEADQVMALQKLDLESDVYLKQKNLSLESFSQLPIRSQAEWIRGISHFAKIFQDWKKSSYDEKFRGITAASLFPEFASTELNRELYPKDAVFALGLSAVSEGLRTITRTPSPFFLVDLQNQITWADQYKFQAGGPQAVMVGVVDQSQGDKSKNVRSEDTARYILAISEFLTTIEDVDQSQSHLLQSARDHASVSPIVELQSNRANLKLLLLGLTNYLSHQMRDAEGLVVSSLNVVSGLPTSQSKSLLDQALAIRALLAASKALKIQLYQWEAQDLLFAMNKMLYQPSLQFYSDVNDRVVLPNTLVMTEMLSAMSEIEPQLPPASQEQIRNLREAWMSQINKVQFQLNF